MSAKSSVGHKKIVPVTSNLVEVPKLAVSTGFLAIPKEPPVETINLPKVPAEKSAEEIETLDYEEMVETHFKRLEMLPLPLNLLRAGLCELGPAPDTLRSVYRKLALPVGFI